jgi:hypothetical protein
LYRIIGADGKEYGPISPEQLKQWISEGRASGQTRIRLEGSTDWKLVSDLPEFSAPPPISTPGVTAPLGPIVPALDQVNGPGIGLIVTGALDIVLSLLRAIMMLAGLSIGSMGMNNNNNVLPTGFFALVGAFGIGTCVLGVIVGVLVLVGGLKMRKCESYGLCVASSILAMIPCLSICCVIGLPAGIWALVVISKAEVKAAFH